VGEATGSVGFYGPGRIPLIPIRFQMFNHLAPYPSSLGMGVFLPFDSSIHYYQNVAHDEFRLVDAAAGFVVTLYDVRPNSSDAADDGIFKDVNGFYKQGTRTGDEVTVER